MNIREKKIIKEKKIIVITREAPSSAIKVCCCCLWREEEEVVVVVLTLGILRFPLSAFEEELIAVGTAEEVCAGTAETFGFLLAVVVSNRSSSLSGRSDAP